ncbi:MAG: ribonuclease III [Bacteroidetes bacterium]|nr:ribonuclease III [Bacteroidota bacterium]
MAFKDWYRGLLRFLPKSMTGKFNLIDHKKHFPRLGFFDSDAKKQLEKLIGTRITDISYYEQAFTHSSYLSILKTEKKVVGYSNERLEFLGDAVLGLIIADHLFNFFPNTKEGELTKIRSRLVNKHTLAYVANKIGLQQFLRISFGTQKNFDKAGESLIANTFEALIAAIYFDAGIEKAVSFLYKTLIPLTELDDFMFDNNYKGKLSEITQAKSKCLPTYKVISAEGPDHNITYNVGVYFNDILLGTGLGKTKKDAEQEASKNALNNFF